MEFGLYFGSMALLPFALLTVLLVEFYARNKPGSLYRTAIAIGSSPVLILLLFVGFISYRQVTFTGPGVDLGQALSIPLAISTFSLSLVFSMAYGFLRTDLVSSIQKLSAENRVKVLLVVLTLLFFVFLYFASFFAV
jgi:hypothetical protein